MKNFIKKYDSYIFQKTTANHLAMARISVALFCYLYISHNTHPDYPDSNFYNIWTPNSIFVFFPRNITADTLNLIREAFKYTLILMFLGLGTRWVTLAAFICGFTFHGYLTSFAGEVYHHSHMAIFGLFTMSLGRVNDSLSLDRLILRKSFFNNTASGNYGYPIVFLHIWIVAVYFTAGIQKLYYGDGLYWAFSQNLRLKLLNTPKVTDLGLALVKQPDYTVYFFGFIGLAVQVLSPITLIYRKALYFFIPLWILFHFFVRYSFGGHFSFFSQVGCYLALIPFIIHYYDERPVEA